MLICFGEAEEVNEKGSFSNAKISQRIAIVAAGAIVNIVFGLAIYFILMAIIKNSIYEGYKQTGILIGSMKDSLVMLFTGSIGLDQMTGPVGISEMVVQTSGIAEFIYLLSVISLSLGVTNLLPIPALDGGKILLLIIEAIRGKKLSEELEIKIQSFGFACLILLSLYVSFNDVSRLF